MNNVERHEVVYNERTKQTVESFISLLKEAKDENALGNFTREMRHKNGEDELVYNFELKELDEKTLKRKTVGEFSVVVGSEYIEKNDSIIKQFDWFCTKEMPVNYVSKRLKNSNRLKKVGAFAAVTSLSLVLTLSFKGEIKSFVKETVQKMVDYDNESYDRQMEEVNRQVEEIISQQEQAEFFENYDQNKAAYEQQNQTKVDRMLNEQHEDLERKSLGF